MRTTADKISKLIAWGAGFTTIFILTGSVSDPVNSTKLLAAGTFAGALISVVSISGIKESFKTNKSFFIAVVAFIFFSIVAVISSESPLAQNLYGVYGRNTGLITYLVLTVFALGATLLRTEGQVEKVLLSFFIAGLINLAYGFWSWQFGDFIAWNNIYGNLLGTFGNPNFMGSFLGMLFGLVLAYTLAPKVILKYRVGGFFFLALIFFEILQTSAVQGLVLTGGSIALCGFFWIWYKFKNKVVQSMYTLMCGIFGLLAILGALQIGPLATYIYKRSVSLRGAYWDAAINTGLSNPLTGVGMDSFGNWYRRSRSLNAVTDTPGAEVTTNAAHSVPLDFFAFGGVLLFFAYLVILGVSGLSLFKIWKRQKTYKPLYIGIGVLWICYQTQSLISINQIGLAIWGWTLSGLIIALERITRISSENSLNIKSGSKKIAIQSSPNFDFIGIKAFLGALVGVLICIPPFSADVSYQTAINSRNGDKLQSALKSNYFKPTDSFRLANTVQVLEKSNLPDLALKYAQIGVEFNPDYTDAWKLLYYVTGASSTERARAKIELIRLDPLNPAWKELK